LATNPFDRVWTQAGAAPGWKEGVGGPPATLVEPDSKHSDSLGLEGCPASLAALAESPHVSTGTEVDILDLQARELREPKAGLNGE